MYIDLPQNSVYNFLSKLKVIKVTEFGCGGTDTTVLVPAEMSHKDVPAEMKEEMD